MNLDVLALVALFTGGLLVFSTQAHAVVRRRAQFALLRVLGVTRRHLTLLIVAEGALIGVAGSALGLGLGYALAQAGRPLGRGGSRLRIFSRRRPDARARAGRARHLLRAGCRGGRGGQLRAGSRGSARVARAGVEGGRRGAGVRASAPGRCRDSP